MSRFLLFLCFSLVIQSASCQLLQEQLIWGTRDENRHKKIERIPREILPITDSLSRYFYLADTLGTLRGEVDTVLVKGNNIHFYLKMFKDSVRFNLEGRDILGIESRISPFHFWRYDVTGLAADSIFVISHELRNKPYDYSELRDAVFQNCISYALEGVFICHGIDSTPFFTPRSVPATFDDLEILLEHFFEMTDTLDVSTPRAFRALKQSETLAKERVFILFRDESNAPIHAFFNLNGKAWTKNGIRPYLSMRPIDVVETYYHPDKSGGVRRIEIYRLLPEKIFCL